MLQIKATPKRMVIKTDKELGINEVVSIYNLLIFSKIEEDEIGVHMTKILRVLWNWTLCIFILHIHFITFDDNKSSSEIKDAIQ